MSREIPKRFIVGSCSVGISLKSGSVTDPGLFRSATKRWGATHRQPPGERHFLLLFRKVVLT